MASSSSSRPKFASEQGQDPISSTEAEMLHKHQQQHRKQQQQQQQQEQEQQQAKKLDAAKEQAAMESTNDNDAAQGMPQVYDHGVNQAAEHIANALAVEEIDVDLYRSVSLWTPARARGVFGGQVIAQALSAASKTVREGPVLHSMHCYFLLAGDASIPIIYTVSRVRDGGSYVTRSVSARQRGRCIFTLISSYQVPEPKQPRFAIPLPDGGLRASSPASSGADAGAGAAASTAISPPAGPLGKDPSVDRSWNTFVTLLRSPEESPPNEMRYVEVLRRYDEQQQQLASSSSSSAAESPGSPDDTISPQGPSVGPGGVNVGSGSSSSSRTPHMLNPKIVTAIREWIVERRNSAVELRDALPGMYDEHGVPTPGSGQAFWMRTRRPMQGGADAQKHALAYASDFYLLSAVPKALGVSSRTKMMASLDHSMWFYDTFDVHDWILYVMQTQSASSGRGVVLGRLYRRDGTLVAVVAQEGLVRARLEDEEKPKL